MAQLCCAADVAVTAVVSDVIPELYTSKCTPCECVWLTLMHTREMWVGGHPGGHGEGRGEGGGVLGAQAFLGRRLRGRMFWSGEVASMGHRNGLDMPHSVLWECAS